MTKIRMWELITRNYVTRLKGVVKGPPPGTRNGACYMPVDLTIVSSAVVRTTGNTVTTMLGRTYLLEGPSRQALIEGA